MNLQPSTSLLQPVLPNEVTAVDGYPRTLQAPLRPDEQPLIDCAVQSRRREVKAGRACARRALAALDRPVVALPPDSDRVPQWPSGTAGSITHTDDYVAAAVVETNTFQSIGIDAEQVGNVPANLEPSIAKPAERDWLAEQDTLDQTRGRALLFSAKEAAYKCHFPVTREPVGFLDATCEVTNTEGDTGTFSVSFEKGPQAATYSPIEGSFTFHEGMVLTGAILEN